MKRVVDGVEYKAVEIKQDSCAGCDGNKPENYSMCLNFRKDCRNKIWIKVDDEETQNKACNMNQTDKTLKAHKHAEAMKLYAEDAATTDKPWELWEHLYGTYGDEEDWCDLENNPTWSENRCYRRKVVKPKTININGYEVPKPYRGSIGIGSKYYVADTTNRSDSVVPAHSWAYLNYEKDLMKKGLIHLTQEAAQKHVEALFSFTRKDK